MQPLLIILLSMYEFYNSPCRAGVTGAVAESVHTLLQVGIILHVNILITLF